MLMPRKVKHRKQHRGRLKGVATGGTELAFGEFGIQALDPGWITARQIEATPLVKEADPELERLLAEEEDIERRTRQHHEAPKFHGDAE